MTQPAGELLFDNIVPVAALTTEQLHEIIGQAGLSTDEQIARVYDAQDEIIRRVDRSDPDLGK